jgi:hypothetical protein
MATQTLWYMLHEARLSDVLEHAAGNCSLPEALGKLVHQKHCHADCINLERPFPLQRSHATCFKRATHRNSSFGLERCFLQCFLFFLLSFFHPRISCGCPAVLPLLCGNSRSFIQDVIEREIVARQWGRTRNGDDGCWQTQCKWQLAA